MGGESKVSAMSKQKTPEWVIANNVKKGSLGREICHSKRKEIGLGKRPPSHAHTHTDTDTDTKRQTRKGKMLNCKEEGSSIVLGWFILTTEAKLEANFFTLARNIGGGGGRRIS